MFDSLYIDDLRVTRVTKVKGLGSPNPRQDVTLKAARHGAIDRTAYYEGRVIDVEGVIVGTTSLDAWTQYDALKGKLQLGSSHVLRFRRSGLPQDEQAAVVVASPVDDVVDYAAPQIIRWGVSLHAPDPRLYVAALSSGIYNPADALSGGGVGMPLTFPLTFPTSTVTVLEVANGGNTSSPPVLTITGPVVNPTIDNVTTGQSIALIYSLGASDVIEVDVAARTVKLNGALRYDLLDAPNTTWWELQPGINALRLRGTGMQAFVAESTTNECANGGFEVDTSGYAGNVGTIARDNAKSMFGTWSLKCHPTGGLGGSGLTFPWVAGVQYTASVYAWIPTGTTVRLSTNATGFPAATGTGDWQRIVQTFTAGVESDLYTQAGGALADFWIDGVQIERKDHATPYLDTNGVSLSRVAQSATQLAVSYRDARI